MLFYEAIQYIRTKKAAFMFRYESSAKYGFDEDKNKFFLVSRQSDVDGEHKKYINNIKEYILEKYHGEDWHVESFNGSVTK